MRAYLQEHQVPAEVIIEEPLGENTFDCTRNAYEHIIIPRGWRSGIIISTDLHLQRVRLQTAKIIPSDYRLTYEGPSIPEGPVRDRFLAHEQEAIIYTKNRKD